MIHNSQHGSATWCASCRATSFSFVFSGLTPKVVHAVPYDVPHLGVFPPYIYKNKGIKVRQMFFRGAQKNYPHASCFFTLYGLVCGFSSSFVLAQKKNETRRKSQGCVCEATLERPDRRSKRNSLRSDSVSPLPPASSLRLTPLRRGRFSARKGASLFASSVSVYDREANAYR